MKILFLSKNKLGFVDGSCSRDPAEKHVKGLWERVNAIVLGWIMNLVTKELLSGVVNSIYAL